MEPVDYRPQVEASASGLRIRPSVDHRGALALLLRVARRRLMPGATAAGFLLAGASAQAQPQPAADFGSCVRSLRAELPKQPPLSVESFDRYTRSAEDLRPLIEKSTVTQPEFKLPVWDYLARLVDAQRVTDGRAVLEREAVVLAGIERRHAVDAATAVAVFGVETDYGRVTGRYPVVDATLSRACLNLASRERKAHFFAALWLLQEGLVRPDTFRGSWAGAFGLTQFMPGTFMENMDDGDASGTIDIVASVPDALATTARFLKGLGWTAGLPWGIEVSVPRDQAQPWNALERDHACLEAATPAGLCRRVEQWTAAGVRRIDGGPLLPQDADRDAPLRSDTSAALLMPAGVDGPAWLVTRNYQAAWRYNRADAYALAIGLLADRLRGAPPMQAAWPTDDAALSRAEVVELQTLLRQRGHCDVTADGHDGPRTRSAIEAEETLLGNTPTGRAGARLLTALRAAVQLEPVVPAACAETGPR
ncbi:MAG: lytic murein transglycosylase [Burkholderiaceae bacterium]|nr:lytic murein transglycosylase [Burkholderiaceae bacterium]